MENFRIKDGMLLKYTGEGKVVTIPDGVHRIGINAFAHNERVTQIYLSNSVRTIGKGAFAHCPHLEEVIFSPEVTEICHFALYDCPNLQRVALPETVKLIGRQAFGKCKSLASFSGSNDIEFDSTAFLGCLHLADEQGFVILGDMLHFYTGKHSKICVPEGVREIGASAFSGNIHSFNRRKRLDKTKIFLYNEIRKDLIIWVGILEKVLRSENSEESI